MFTFLCFVSFKSRAFHAVQLYRGQFPTNFKCEAESSWYYKFQTLQLFRAGEKTKTINKPAIFFISKGNIDPNMTIAAPKIMFQINISFNMFILKQMTK